MKCNLMILFFLFSSICFGGLDQITKKLLNDGKHTVKFKCHISNYKRALPQKGTFEFNFTRQQNRITINVIYDADMKVGYSVYGIDPKGNKRDARVSFEENDVQIGNDGSIRFVLGGENSESYLYSGSFNFSFSPTGAGGRLFSLSFDDLSYTIKNGNAILQNSMDGALIMENFQNKPHASFESNNCELAHMDK